MLFGIVSVSAVPVHCPVDIIFVLDESGRGIGATNFDLAKSFLTQLVARLDIDSGNTRVGLVTSSGIGSSFNLNAYFTVSSVQAAILSLNYTGGGTDTAGSLAYVRTTMLTSAAGDRSNVSNVVVVLTDGNSDDPHDTQVRKMHRMLFVLYSCTAHITLIA